MKRNILGVISFIVVTIFLYIYISKVFLPALDVIGGYQNENVSPTAEQSEKAMKLILPVFYIYAGSTFAFFYFKISGFNKIVFPICVFTFYYVFMNLELASMGVAFIWLVVITWIPAIAVLLISIILGWRIDKKTTIR